MSLSLDPPIGTELAGYRIEELVGRGGMGIVYRATDLRLERAVALKLIAPELAADVHFRERFLRESRLAASLDHPNVIPIYEAGESEGQLFIAMRYVEGEDLKSRLGQTRQVSPDRALAICGQVANALDAAHRRGLVHRDVKPANILLDGQDHAYLSDFGLTKQLGGASTQTGQLVGTLDYLAPEQIRGEQVDGRTDEYALACVLYECLAASPPFRRGTEAEVLWAHMQDKAPSLPANPALDPILRKGLAKAREDRFESCSEFVEAAANALGFQAPTFSRRRLFGKAFLRRERALALVGALFLAGAVAAATVELTTGGHRGLGSLAANSLGLINGKTKQIVTQIPLAGGPAHIAIGGRFVWVGGDDSGTLSALDPHSQTVAKLIPTRGFPSDLAVTGGSVWVLDGRSGLLSRIDPAYATVRRTQVAKPNPVYDVSREGVDPTSIAAGFGSLWLTDGSTSLTRVDAGTGRIAQRINLRRLLTGVAVGTSGVWAISGPSATAIRLDRQGRVTVRIPIVSQPGFESPFPIAVAVGEGYVWVLNANTASVTKIDPLQRAVSATIPIGIDKSPVRLAVGKGAAWVANRDGTVDRIDASTNAVTIIPVGHSLRDIAVGKGGVWITTGSGLTGTESKNAGAGGVRALPTSSCSPVYYEGGGRPDYLIASDLPLQGSGTVIPQLGQAVQFVLRQHHFRAGRFAVAYQSCDDSTAGAGHWAPARCLANAHAYATDLSVIGVIGTFNSPCSALELPILNRASRGPLALVSPANTYVGLTHSGPGTAETEPGRYYPTGRRSFVRVVVADDVQGAADALLARQLGLRRVYVLNDGESYGMGLAADFEATARRVGLKLVGAGVWNPAARSYAEIAARIKQSAAEAVLLAGLVESNGGTLVRALRTGLGPRVRIMATDGFANFPVLLQTAGASAEGMTVSLPGLPPERLPKPGQAFVKAFGTAVGESPYGYSAYAAQAAEVLLAAIARSNGTRASVTAELFKTRISNGLVGSFAFNRNGDPTEGAVTFYRIVHGIERVLRVITPRQQYVGGA